MGRAGRRVAIRRCHWRLAPPPLVRMQGGSGDCGARVRGSSANHQHASSGAQAAHNFGARWGLRCRQRGTPASAAHPRTNRADAVAHWHAGCLSARCRTFLQRCTRASASAAAAAAAARLVPCYYWRLRPGQQLHNARAHATAVCATRVPSARRTRRAHALATGRAAAGGGPRGGAGTGMTGIIQIYNAKFITPNMFERMRWESRGVVVLTAGSTLAKLWLGVSGGS